jgi:hypothetical protein
MSDVPVNLETVMDSPTIRRLCGLAGITDQRQVTAVEVACFAIYTQLNGDYPTLGDLVIMQREACQHETLKAVFRNFDKHVVEVYDQFLSTLMTHYSL